MAQKRPRQQQPRERTPPAKLRALAALVMSKAAAELPKGSTDEQVIQHWLTHPLKAVGMALRLTWKHPNPEVPPLPQAVVDHLAAEDAAELNKRLDRTMPTRKAEKVSRRL